MAFLGMCALCLGGPIFDAAKNPWLEQIAQQYIWHWYSLLDSGHASALLYLKHSPWFVINALVVSLATTAWLWWHDHAHG